MKANRTLLMEFIMDLMNDNKISLKEFCVAFFKSRIRNNEYQESFIAGIEEEIKKLKVEDSKDLHPSLFGNEE